MRGIVADRRGWKLFVAAREAPRGNRTSKAVAKEALEADAVPGHDGLRRMEQIRRDLVDRLTPELEAQLDPILPKKPARKENAG